MSTVGTVIADLDHAKLSIVAVNEIGFDQKLNPDGTPTLDDPIKLRFGAGVPADRGKFYISTISFDVLRMKDGKVHRTEVGFLKMAVDEMVDGDGHPVPMVELFLTNNTTGSTDEDIDRVITVSRKGVIFHVPVVGNIPAPAPSPEPTLSEVTRFWSDTKQFCYNVQGDPASGPRGKIIAYDTWKPGTQEREPDEQLWRAVGQIAPTAL